MHGPHSLIIKSGVNSLELLDHSTSFAWKKTLEEQNTPRSEVCLEVNRWISEGLKIVDFHRGWNQLARKLSKLDWVLPKLGVVRSVVKTVVNSVETVP